MTRSRTKHENICDECGLPISICNAKAMFEQAVIRNGREAVIAAILDAQTEQPTPEAVTRLVEAAWSEAQRAMTKFPQPNYVISKVAEEAGEVVKAAIHCAEGRETAEAVIGEVTQAMAMLMRLYVEGDQVHGLPALAAMETNYAS